MWFLNFSNVARINMGCNKYLMCAKCAASIKLQIDCLIISKTMKKGPSRSFQSWKWHIQTICNCLFFKHLCKTQTCSNMWRKSSKSHSQNEHWYHQRMHMKTTFPINPSVSSINKVKTTVPHEPDRGASHCWHTMEANRGCNTPKCQNKCGSDY